MKTAELTPTAQKIAKLIKRIDEGDIKIPAFQRGYVWKQNQVRRGMGSPNLLTNKKMTHIKQPDLN